jgi:hypothetical protein
MASQNTKASRSEPDYKSLDEGIRDAVKILAQTRIETFGSCQSGEGHAYPEPPTSVFMASAVKDARRSGIALEFLGDAYTFVAIERIQS